MRIGVIGTNWGRMHVGGFRGAGAEVSAICGRDLEKTRRVAREEGIPLGTTSVDELIDAADAIVVAGPDGLHVNHVLAALARGRAVLCEKPLARTLEEAERLVQAAARAAVPCAVNFPYRKLKPLVTLREWLEKRTILRAIVSIRNGFGPEPQDPSGSLLGGSGDFGGMSHGLDALMWLMGTRPESVTGVLQGRPVHSAMLHLSDERAGRLASFHQVLCPEPGIHGAWSLVGDGWEVGFTAGYVPARGGWCVAPVRLFTEGTWRDLAPGEEPEAGRREPWVQAHVETARSFLRLLEGGHTDGTLASFEDGRNVQWVLDQVMSQRASQP